MPKVKTVPKLCLDLDCSRGELVWFGLESIFAHANPQHPFSKLLGAQCSSTTNGRAVATFLNFFFTILRFFPFSKLLVAQCSLATKARQVATNATTPVSKRLGAQVVLILPGGREERCRTEAVDLVNRTSFWPREAQARKARCALGSSRSQGFAEVKRSRG